MQKLMNGPLKSFVAAQARKQVAQRARPEHYPAPYAILDMWANYGGDALAVPADLDGSHRHLADDAGPDPAMSRCMRSAIRPIRWWSR